MIKKEDVEKLNFKGNKGLKTLIEEVAFVEITVKEKVKSVVQNKNIPLNIRFYLLTNSEITPIDNYYHHPEAINWNKMTLYDDFACDKYATLLASDMIEMIEDMKEEDDSEHIQQIDVDELKEYFCQKFIKGFENYW